MKFNYKKCVLIFLPVFFFGCSSEDNKDEIDGKNPIDLSTEMTVNNLKPAFGTALHFYIKVTNKGPSEAKNVKVVNKLPAGYDFDKYDGYFLEGDGEIVYDQANGVFTIEKMSNGAIVSLTVSVTVKNSGDYNSKVTVSSKQKDLDPSNDSVTITPTPKALDNIDSLLNYEVINGEVTILGRSELNNGLTMPFPENYSIPSHIDGYPVTKIASPAFSYAEFVNLTIPNTVTTIGSDAFRNCERLKNVTMANSVTSIEANAFAYCERLENVILSNKIKEIEYGAFQFCKNLEYINIPDGVVSIGNDCFYFCSKLKKIDIPNSITTIGMNAFRHCIVLQSIILPEKLKEIKAFTFYGCDIITSINIPNSVTKIERSAFQVCIKLTDVSIGNGVNTIEEKAFTPSGFVSIKMTITSKVPPKVIFTEGGLLFGRLLNANNGEYIKVPAESVDIYKNAEGWSAYKDVIIKQ